MANLLTAGQIMHEMNEFFRHHNSVDPHAMIDNEQTFKQAVERWLESHRRMKKASPAETELAQ